MNRKVCIVTGSRAEYGLLYWLLKEIKSDQDLDLQLIVTGTHFSDDFGLTYREIEEDGFDIDWKVELSLGDTCKDTANCTGQAINSIYDAYEEMKPDIVVFLGDRYEIFAAAVSATIAKIPIAHIHGGESTEGAFDEAFRHSITKMSYIHFASAETYRNRIIQMGESPDRVFCVGALGLENIQRLPLLDKEELQKKIGFTFGAPTFLVTYHPETLGERESKEHVVELLSALDSYPYAKIIFTHSNADPDSLAIRAMIEDYVCKNRDRSTVYTSLGQMNYLSVMRCVDLVIGNSSSGVIETPSFNIPTVNIGDRQKGRLMADSIINCPVKSAKIKEAIDKALSDDFRKDLPFVENPYGDGRKVSVRIKNILKELLRSEGMLKKEFYDINFKS